ncbi:MAG: cellulase family glycosylhydrolase [Atopobiaceae bacterium]|nr:cellulase family glycosylhydrolase [Atopobiaceae bacterium]
MSSLAAQPQSNLGIHGVNLAGWLVLESWVTPDLFSGTGALDEAGLLRSLGLNRYQRLVDEHRKNFITKQDFDRIAARGLDAIRLPVPWFAFENLGPAPGAFLSCENQLELAFEWAEQNELKLLLDLVDVPFASSSETEGRLDITKSRFRSSLLDVLAELAKRFGHRDGLLGIQVLDSPRAQSRLGLAKSDSVPLHFLRNFYRDAYERIRAHAGQNCVVVLSDAGRAGAWRRFMAQKNYVNVWLDCHLYRYADVSASADAQDLRKLVAKSAHILKKAQASGLPVVVGEWSAALPAPQPHMTPEGRVALERVYSSAQMRAYEGAAAWFFQTWKTSQLMSGWDARVALSTFEKEMLD